MRVAFRVDASAVIGIGHVKRCLALAHALARLGADILFVTRDLGEDTVALIEAEHFTAVKLASPSPDSAFEPEPTDPPHARWAGVSQEFDAGETRTVLALKRFEWVVVDHYAFDERWHRSVAMHTSMRVCVIDDLADRPLRADLVVDHNPAPDHRAKYEQHARSKPRLLGGPRFALLAPRYAEATLYAFNPIVGSIGIFMGGADAIQASAVALRACREVAGFKGPIQVAAASVNRHLDELRSLCKCMGPTELLIDLPDLIDFFQRHDLQVGAGGGAAWERCCLGAPTLTVQCATNQSVVVDALESLGVTRTSKTLDVYEIGREIAALALDTDMRRRLSAESQKLVDGRGAHRVALALFADALVLRQAQLADATLLYAWRNDPRSRKYARNPAPISLDAHLSWWSRSLENENCHLLVACAGSDPIGSVRFDLLDDAAELSIYLDPGLAGLGLGTGALRAAQQWITSRTDHPSRLEAEIHPDNVASTKAFKAAGFSRVSPLNWIWEISK